MKCVYCPNLVCFSNSKIHPPCNTVNTQNVYTNKNLTSGHECGLLSAWNHIINFSNSIAMLTSVFQATLRRPLATKNRYSCWPYISIEDPSFNQPAITQIIWHQKTPMQSVQETGCVRHIQTVKAGYGVYPYRGTHLGGRMDGACSGPLAFIWRDG